MPYLFTPRINPPSPTNKLTADWVQLTRVPPGHNVAKCCQEESTYQETQKRNRKVGDEKIDFISEKKRMQEAIIGAAKLCSMFDLEKLIKETTADLELMELHR